MTIIESGKDSVKAVKAADKPSLKAKDNLLRPSSFKGFIGQAKIVKNLKVYLDAAKKRKESPDHLLFYGPPGLGKTTLAHVIAKELGVNIRITSGPAIERTG